MNKGKRANFFCRLLPVVFFSTSFGKVVRRPRTGRNRILCVPWEIRARRLRAAYATRTGVKQVYGRLYNYADYNLSIGPAPLNDSRHRIYINVSRVAISKLTWSSRVRPGVDAGETLSLEEPKVLLHAFTDLPSIVRQRNRSHRTAL